MKLNPNGVKANPNINAAEFISRRFETLVAEFECTPGNKNKEIYFDIVVVGSGYGGAMAASEFAEMRKAGNDKQLSVCLLERGTERLPGSFPSTLAQLPTEIRVFAHTPNETPLTNDPKVLGNRSGLFDLRVGDGQSALVGNGLGGGSLINAGVMLQPANSVFADSIWPTAIRNDEELNQTFQKSLEMVGATIGTEDDAGNVSPITVGLLPKKLKKFEALDKLGACENGAEPVPIAVKMSDQISNQTIDTETCIQCGDCFSGCNHNAKRSLDTNLLAKAAVAGAKLYCGATVLSFDKLEDGTWELTCTYTDETMLKHLAGYVKIRCEKLVIAAGTLGSTELLLRSQNNRDEGLKFSEQLGEHFSGNGDMIANISDNKQTINSVASEFIPPAERNIGPTITGMIDMRESETPAVIQELAVPALLRRLLIQTTAFTQSISAITSPKRGFAKFSERFCTINPLGPVGIGDKGPTKEVLGMSDAETDRIAILAVMGQDNMTGRMFLPSKAVKSNATAQGTLAIEFPVSPDPNLKESSDSGNAHPKNIDPTFYDKNMNRLEKLLKSSDSGAWLHANPLWKPLGSALEKMFDVNAQAMQITVHPLGGCAMGESNQQGVVNHIGQVFDQSATDTAAVHDGLVVLDGSIIPKALGVNPALTIAALALRATSELAREWNWKKKNSTLAYLNEKISRKRTAIKPVLIHSVKKKPPTKVELVERLTGEVTLSTEQGDLPCIVELRLRSSPFNILEYSRFKQRSVPLREAPKSDPKNALPDQSYLRIFSKIDWDKTHVLDDIMQDREGNRAKWMAKKRALLEDYDNELDKLALLKGNVTGRIQLLEENPLHWIIRLLLGTTAWFLNRGFRDILQSITSKFFSFSSISSALGSLSFPSFRTEKMRLIERIYYLQCMLAVFSHTGRERQFSYNLVVGNTTTKSDVLTSRFTGRKISGVKTFAYRRKSNPWRQLMDIEVTNFPYMVPAHSRTLRVDPGFFARTHAPLFHIVEEANAIDGSADIIDFYAHMIRVFTFQQLWAFRKPDTPDAPPTINSEGITVKRLPAILRDVHREAYVLDISNTVRSVQSDFTIQARLTRFKPNKQTRKYPVICIHGYSASGSTYAHHSLYGGKGKTGGLTQYMVDRGHDVWVLDMRSSSAFTCAQSPWDFEHMAYNDIPLAIQKVINETNAEKVNIVAHCMGAAMLSMTLLGEPEEKKDQKEELEQERQNLDNAQSYINRIVLSQAGPFLKFTPMNTMRAWLLGFVKELLPKNGYAFNPDTEASAWETILDRFLNTLPYPHNSDDSEFDRENPIRGDRKWVRTRHRMDALYGKTFSLSSMSDEILDHIDEYFGPFSFQTLEQTLPISKRGQISSRYGTGFDIESKHLLEQWTFPTLWIHGEDNGLIDPISPALTALRFDEAKNPNLTIKVISNRGHQDCLMGKDCSQSFQAIAAHLDQ